jgi:hypothetical protein
MAGLTQKIDGSYLVRSESDAVLALELRDQIQEELDELLTDERIVGRHNRIQALNEAVDGFVLENYKDLNDPFQPAKSPWKGTPVRASTHKWEIDVLRELMPSGLFLKVIDYVPNGDKIAALVKAGKIKREMIEPAYSSVPKKPYVRWTKKADKDAGKKEAARLKRELG